MKKHTLAKDIVEKINNHTKLVKKDFDARLIMASKASDDELKTERLDKRECRRCFYFTKQSPHFKSSIPHNCEICHSHMVYSSMQNNKTCLSCSIKYDICSHCMCHIELVLPTTKKISKAK